ncbi:MAG TPA: hypothetical protein VFC21_00735 [Bryobacteraceae bacterium]|nr:hypothetical protein [Bryobacteraceae bacterium]
MTVTARDKKALLALAAAGFVALLVNYGLPGPAAATAPAAHSDNVALVEQRVARLRQLAALAPEREAVMKQVASDLAERERGLIQADTAAQAQAAVLEVARRVGKGNQIDIRGGDFPAPKAFGEYGLVYAAVTFDCHIEQYVNFLADLSRQKELVVPSEERINSGPVKQKMVNVRMILASVVPKKLIPEKKGLGAF